jgi:hypothetical protein
MPILEALFMAAFIVNIDLFKYNSPTALWNRIEADPDNKETYKKQWWERFKWMTTRIIKTKFPPTSLFAVFENWEFCHMCNREVDELLHYPFYDTVDGEWMLCCNSQTFKWGAYHSDFRNASGRKDLWVYLVNADTFYHNSNVYADGKKDNRLMSVTPEWYQAPNVVRFSKEYEDRGICCTFRKIAMSITFRELCWVLKADIVDLGDTPFYYP